MKTTGYSEDARMTPYPPRTIGMTTSIRRRHHKIDKPWMAHPRCAECSPETPWPCDAARMVEVVEAAERLDALVPGEAYGVADLRGALQRLAPPTSEE